MAKKKQKPAKKQPALNDKNYLASGRARKLPIYKCEINADWEAAGIAQVLVHRQHVNGHLTVGVYLVDLFCAGVKDTFYYFNEPQSYITDVFRQAFMQRETISYALAHNIIYGAVAYAEDLGIDPDPTFKLTRQLLEEDTEAIPLIDIAFGLNGKPVLVLNPSDPRNDYYKRQLAKTLAPDEYAVENLYIRNGELLDDEDDFYAQPEFWEDEDWDEFIEDTIPEELHKSGTIASYIYRKTTPIPANAAPVVEAITTAPAFTISDDDLPATTYRPSAEEQEEIYRIEDELDKITVQIDATLLQKLKKAVDVLDKPEEEEQTNEEPAEPENAEQARQQGLLIAELKQNSIRWPHNPVFQDQLIQLYHFADLPAEADKMAVDFYHKFPDYLPAKIRYADFLIENNQADQVMAVFNGQYSLSAIYPNQPPFSMMDVVSFYSLMARYFLHKNDIFLANYYVNLLEDLDIPEDIPVDLLTIVGINQETAKLLIPILERARENETNKQELIDLLMA